MTLSRILDLADSSEGFSRIRESLARGERAVGISGLAGSGKALLLAHLKKNLDLPFLVITAKPEEALKRYDDLVSFLGPGTLIMLPAWEYIPNELNIQKYVYYAGRM